jgi:hypothetical protein
MGGRLTRVLGFDRLSRFTIHTAGLPGWRGRHINIDDTDTVMTGSPPGERTYLPIHANVVYPSQTEIGPLPCAILQTQIPI